MVFHVRLLEVIHVAQFAFLLQNVVELLRGLFRDIDPLRHTGYHIFCINDLMCLQLGNLDHRDILQHRGRYNSRLHPTLMNTDPEQQEIQKRNFRYVQIDAVGVSISNVAAPFLPVFLTRLGASNFQVGLLTSMPGITGLILAIIVGRFLQNSPTLCPGTASRVCLSSRAMR